MMWPATERAMDYSKKKMLIFRIVGFFFLAVIVIPVLTGIGCFVYRWYPVVCGGG